MSERGRGAAGQTPKTMVFHIGDHKTGSTSTPKEFKRLVKAICKADEAQSHMPD